MARPRKHLEKHRPRHLGFRTPIWVHEAVHRLAAEQEQPVSDIANDLLEIALGHLGIKKPRPGAITEGR
jgi:predicted metal-dependent phosphotriesterase family hydrolase